MQPYLIVLLRRVFLYCQFRLSWFVLGGRKGPNSVGKIGVAGVPSTTFGTGSSTPRHKAVSCDKSVRRSVTRMTVLWEF